MQKCAKGHSEYGDVSDVRPEFAGLNKRRYEHLLVAMDAILKALLFPPLALVAIVLFLIALPSMLADLVGN